ncbi:RNA polymerase sigma factor SigY [Paenibacillus agricola]|uniref:RNA polymerase sigma factor n=1 Tax=Paenibacillus agricola TaxID=2716264 RepID=A0ABX0J210_9BACL|nr:RNA polymerase sigma factor SigY [Paenibacillus agricola]NHN29993.1 RNA polymerase sigma factor SigY [Paenibacillus agricola]
MTDERELVILAQKGDNQALSILFQQNYGFLKKYLIKTTLNLQAAEDLTQETLLRGMEKLHLYKEKSKFSSWLITIANRIYIDGLRKQTRERRWQEQEHITATRHLQWQLAQQGGEWDDVLSALHELSYEARAAIILKHYYGYSQEEIADMLGVPTGTIKSRIHNGLNHLRKELGEHGEA